MCVCVCVCVCERERSLVGRGSAINLFFLPIFSNYSRMQVLEMTMWCILCGVLMIVGLLGAVVEGEI